MQSSEKTLEILEEFLSQADGITVSELANLKGLSVSSIYRTVSVLKKKGYLDQRNKRGKYFLGPKFIEFCNILRTSMKLEDIAHPFLKELNDKIGEIVHLSVLDGNKAVDREIIPSSKDLILRIEFRLGDKFPLFCTAVGKVFLAYMAENERQKYFSSSDLKAYTNYTTTNTNELIKQVENVKQEGVAFDYEEYVLGLNTLASPVINRSGDIIASVGIAGPSARMTREKIESLVNVVKKCALNISRSLGYEGRDLAPD